ncbi:hypothetical protein [Xanthobacter sp. KR7-225]|uniref:hypothetical protein n=1 Tax=Xanthobacter sp. KR7-225 TaxID=3156613 RepID=UPI0032B5D50F
MFYRLSGVHATPSAAARSSDFGWSGGKVPDMFPTALHTGHYIRAMTMRAFEPSGVIHPAASAVSAAIRAGACGDRALPTPPLR